MTLRFFCANFFVLYFNARQPPMLFNASVPSGFKMATSVFPSANKKWVAIHSFSSFPLLSFVVAVIEVAAIFRSPRKYETSSVHI